VGLTGRNVPVVAGADRALLAPFVTEPRIHGEQGIGGVVLPPGPPATPGIAADAIRGVLRGAGEGEITLVGIGPATNLALALATEPALASRVGEIVLMTGAWAEGNATPAAEFNAWNDPEALEVVLGIGRPVTLVTLELTAQALCTSEWLARLAAQGEGRCLRAAHAIMSAVPPSRRLGGKGHPLHDPCTIAWLLSPEMFTSRNVHVRVDTGHGPGRGRTIIDRWGRLSRPSNARLLEALDAAAFFDLLGRSLVALP
jgi:purine nucleosidase